MKIDRCTEPYIKATILTPEEYVGPVMELCREYRSESQTMNYLSVGRVEVISEMPLGEVLFEFYGKLKTITRGYGSFDYVPIEYRETDVVKVDILVNGEPVDTLSYLVHRDKAQASGIALLRATGRGDSRATSSRSRSRAHRRQDHRPIDDRRLSQGRDCKVLRRRRFAEEQAPRQAEEGQGENEAGRPGADTRKRRLSACWRRIGSSEGGHATTKDRPSNDASVERRHRSDIQRPEGTGRRRAAFVRGFFKRTPYQASRSDGSFAQRVFEVTGIGG